jgi:hypothetical protein
MMKIQNNNKEDFVIPEDSIEILDILIGGELRTFRYVTELTADDVPCTRDTLRIDGIARTYEFKSVIRTTDFGVMVEKYANTNPKCFGIVVFVDKTIPID